MYIAIDIALDLVANNRSRVNKDKDKNKGQNKMNNDEEQLEQEIKDKGLTAPRITPAMLDAAIVGEEYHVFDATQLTICVLTLKNGFTVTGESACVSAENFDEEKGRNIARRNARDKIWLLLGFLLADKLSDKDMLCGCEGLT